MFCNKCGAEIDTNAKFCNKCGEKLEGYIKTGNITFRREGQYVGCLVPVKVFMDGILVATLSAGAEQTVQATIGKHKVEFDLWSGHGTNEVDLTQEHPNIKVVFKLGMGAFTSKPKIVSIINL